MLCYDRKYMLIYIICININRFNNMDVFFLRLYFQNAPSRHPAFWRNTLKYNFNMLFIKIYAYLCLFSSISYHIFTMYFISHFYFSGDLWESVMLNFPLSVQVSNLCESVMLNCDSSGHVGGVCESVMPKFDF